MIDVRKLEKEQLDALKEIGMVGAGNAATALSQLINKRIGGTVPRVSIVPIEEVAELVQDPRTPGAGVYLKVFGKIRGSVLVLYPKESVLILVDNLMNRKLGTTKELSADDQSAIKEVSHIITGSYLNALAQFLSMFLIPSVSEIAFDTVGELLSLAAARLDRAHKYVLSIDTEFTAIPAKIDLYFIFMPEPKFLDVLLEAVGM